MLSFSKIFCNEVPTRLFALRTLLHRTKYSNTICQAECSLSHHFQHGPCVITPQTDFTSNVSGIAFFFSQLCWGKKKKIKTGKVDVSGEVKTSLENLHQEGEAALPLINCECSILPSEIKSRLPAQPQKPH